MDVKAKISVVILLFAAVFLVSATVTIARNERDREIAKGRHSLPQDMLVVCQMRCQYSAGEDQPECFRKCMKYDDEQEERGSGGGNTGSWTEKEGKGGKERQSNNPYVFEDHHFTTKVETEHGSVRFLQKFTDRSDIFRGIENYRVAFLEAEPETFVIPNHWDADMLLFVIKGEATASLIYSESRESFNLNRGDLFLVPAGINAYLINRNNNEKLVLAKIYRSISVPGELQTFLTSGGDNPESSLFNVFSTEVLEAAFASNGDDIERLFKQPKQEQGVFKKASEEQIRSMSGHEGGRKWPFSERKGPYNIFKKDPAFQNEYGSLHQADSHKFRDLRDINVAFSFFNITQGSMVGPFYNSKATTVVVVPNGEGRFEMACPHLSESTGGGSGFPSYERVSSRLRRGIVVVFPVGHPVVIEASNNQNLEVICFGLNSDENEWFPLTGENSVMSQWEDEAVELTFGVPAREAQQVINNQKDTLFFKGPQRRGRAVA